MLLRREEATEASAPRALPFPSGVRVLFPEEATRRRAIEARIVALLEQADYREVILPILDFAGCYDEFTNALPVRSSYRLVDRDGELLALRSDFTPMVARALAPVLEPSVETRILYRGDVVRCESARLGGGREYFQIGAELVGDASFDADLEIVRLAVAASGEGCTVSCGDASLPKLLERDAADDERAAQLLHRLRRGALEVSDLATFRATEVLAERFEQLESALADAGSRLVVAFDPGDAGGYYSGIRFRIYASRSNTLVARGGRYDALYERFGADVPAVGFTLSVDALEGMR